jgi:hypothetical protein
MAFSRFLECRRDVRELLLEIDESGAIGLNAHIVLGTFGRDL